MPAIVNEKVEGQTARKTRVGWEMERVWQVRLEDISFAATAAVEAVTNASNGADIGDGHPVNPFIYLVSLVP